MKRFSLKLMAYKLYRSLFPRTKADSLPLPLRTAERWRSLGVPIGENTELIGNVTFGRGGKDPITVGKNCVLVNCAILGHDACTNRALGISRSPCIPVVIEDDCFIGLGSVILMGVTIGQGSIVGAGSVVTKNVPPGSVVGGNPARVLCTVAELVERRKQLAIEHPEYFPELPALSHHP